MVCTICGEVGIVVGVVVVLGVIRAGTGKGWSLTLVWGGDDGLVIGMGITIHWNKPSGVTRRGKGVVGGAATTSSPGKDICVPFLKVGMDGRGIDRVFIIWIAGGFDAEFTNPVAQHPFIDNDEMR